MEIYQLYNFVASFFEALFETLSATNPSFQGGFSSYGAWLATSLAIAGGLWALLFVLQAFGLYYMAKRQGLSDRHLAFIPFASTLYMSKIAGQCTFFGRKMKHAGVYALIAQSLCAVVCGMLIASEMYLYIGCVENMQIVKEVQLVGEQEIVVGTRVYWTGLAGFAKVVNIYYIYSSYVLSIFELAYEILMLVVIIALLRKYAPKHYFPLSILALFVPLSRYIMIFALKKRAPIDYEAYMRKRRADYIYHQQQYYNQFGNPYANQGGQGWQNNPNGQGYPNAQNPQAPQNGQNPAADDPFEEFSSGTNHAGAQPTNGGANPQPNDEESKEEFFN